jgi:hypothetical protein
VASWVPLCLPLALVAAVLLGLMILTGAELRRYGVFVFTYSVPIYEQEERLL